MLRYDYSFQMLGTTCTISIVAPDDTGLDQVIQSACMQIRHFDRLFSRFRKDSTLSRLNERKTAVVDTDFIDLFECARSIYRRTEGAFNPLSDIRTLGYITSFEETIQFSLHDIPEDLDMEAIVADGSTLTLRPSMHLDFGAIAKGYIADRVAHSLDVLGYTDYMVNLGGDIVLRGVNQNDTLPTVGILSPTLQWFIASISVRDASVSTSGSYIRRWQISDQEYFHIKNPGSQKQNKDLSSVTIVAPHGYESDALATAVFVMWLDRGLAFCDTHHIDALCIGRDGTMRFTKGFDEKYALVREQTGSIG